MKNGILSIPVLAALLMLSAASQSHANGPGVAFSGHASGSAAHVSGGGFGGGTVFAPSYTYSTYGGYYPYGSAFPYATYTYPEPGASDLDSSNYDGTTWLAMEVQGVLAREGYYDGRLSGVVGTNTHVAISNYQQDHGFPITGTINTRLLIALGLREP